MDRFRFSEVKAIIADSAELSARTIRSLLSNRGMRDFTNVRDIETLRETLENKSFDLLVCNAHIEDEDVTPLLRDVRQGDLGANPFVPIIALAWEPSVETVSHLLSGGVDVILTLPLSADKMDKALEALVVRRKPFVVTADYIGPDRRRQQRPNTKSVPMTVVPNPIKRKALGKDEADDHDEVLKDIFDQRVESYISRVTFAIGKISGLTGDGGDGEKGTMSNWLEELHQISLSLAERIADTSYAHQTALCRSLIDVTQGIAGRGTVDASEMELLQQIALALEIAVRKDDYDTVHAAMDINKLIEETVGTKSSKP